MEVVILIVVFGLSLLLSSGALAGALYITGEGLDQEDLLKCLGITLAAMVVGMIPMLGFLSIVVWIASVMAVFEKTWLEALLIGLACWVISAVLVIGLGVGLAAIGIAAGAAG